MSTLSSPGIGSGLDIKNIVSQLVELEKRPLTGIQLRTTAAQTRLSVVGQIKNQLSSLDDALRTLTLSATYGGKTVSSANSSAVTGSAAFTATEATYNVQVQQLARGQVAQSVAMPATAAVGAGQLTLQMGRWDSGPVFAPQGSAVTINISASDTLANVANKINESGAPVRALVVSDASGQRLVIRANDTGVNAGFRIQVSDSDGNNTDNNGLSRLGYDPAAGSFGLTQTQSAQNTLVQIDGVSVESSTRTISSALPGVTLTVNETTSQPVAVQVKRDDSAVRSALDAFVKAYNQLNQTINDATRYDAQTGVAGPLQGDSTLITLQAALRRLVGTAGPQTAVGSRLSDIGLQLQRDGSLQVDNGKFSAALSQPEALKELLSQNSTGQTLGLARQMRDFTSGALATDGRMNQKTRALEGEIQRLGEQAQKINDRAARTEQRLLQQYSRLDRVLADMNALNQYVSQQITLWNKSGSR